ncbi:MAG: metallophosphoesterase [Cytophagaceae bacterium]|nr:metallophosphoesterase [Cytophagaceae bacterium]
MNFSVLHLMNKSDFFKYLIPEKNKEFKPYPMVGWYNVRQLITTGVKSLVSGIFGSYADRREIQAAISGNESFDYSGEKDLWLDYVADLGDGFNSTFTVASLLAADHLTVDNYPTHRGKVLVMGGDQVYPVANKKHYETRFISPYEIAYPKNEKENDHPHLFAIPGNHDWYDGLANFLKIFINDRFIGNWYAMQHRSYFALKLRENVWLWGIDIQLDADIDKPQLDYFAFASSKMKKGDKIILCTSKPSWIYKSKEEEVNYKILEYFENKYIIEKGFELLITLAGDSHHYSRYSRQTENGTVHKIISGGGGAFLHPTHNLQKKIRVREGEMELKKTFPSKEKSSRLLFLNFLFPFFNPEFSAFMGTVYLFMAWLLQSVTYYSPVFAVLSKIEPAWYNIPVALHKIMSVIIFSPGLLIIVFGIFFGSMAFSDKRSGKFGFAYVAGIIQGLLHIVSGLSIIWILSYLSFHEAGYNYQSIFIFSAGMFLLGGFSGSLVLGIYLMLSNAAGIHDNEAFSSLRWEGYKNFLRFHIAADKITIYPIGLTKIIKWKVRKGYIEGEKPQPHLIEEPIIIKL